VWICRHYLGIEKGKIDKTQGASSLNQKLAKKKKKKKGNVSRTKVTKMK
jgi:hypothetical protein